MQLQFFPISAGTGGGGAGKSCSGGVLSRLLLEDPWGLAICWALGGGPGVPDWKKYSPGRNKVFNVFFMADLIIKKTPQNGPKMGFFLTSFGVPNLLFRRFAPVTGFFPPAGPANGPSPTVHKDFHQPN